MKKKINPEIIDISKPEYKPNSFKQIKRDIELRGLELKKTVKVNGK
jgi:hypothetical protein